MNDHADEDQKNALVIDGLIKTYGNGVHALKGIDIKVKQGDFFALLGPNGAGKSTLIGVLTSLVRKTSGKVCIYGHDIDREFEVAKTYIGLVPQEFNFHIFEKVEDVLLAQAGYYGISYRQALPRVERYLRQLNLWDKRHEMSRSLSGGMKRRLMIARALVHQPKMLILDEPTAGVDIEIRHSMWDFLVELNNQGVTIILTTHYLEEAERLCRNIAIIDHGEIVANTAMSTILSQLDRERFILFLREPYQALPVVNGYSINAHDNSTLEVEVPRGESISVLLSALQQQGCDVISLRNKSNQLEQLFLDLTANHDEL